MKHYNNQNDAYSRAKYKVNRIKRFYNHLAAYIIVNTLFIVLKIVEITSFIFVPYYVGLGFAWKLDLDYTCSPFAMSWLVGTATILIPIACIVIVSIAVTANLALTEKINKKLKAHFINRK